jgi:hypothetical protein
MLEVTQNSDSVKAPKVGAAKRHLLERLALLRQAKRLRVVRFAPREVRAEYDHQLYQLDKLKKGRPRQELAMNADPQGKDLPPLVAELSEITGTSYEVYNDDERRIKNHVSRVGDNRARSFNATFDVAVSELRSAVRDLNGKHYDGTAVELLEDFISDDAELDKVFLNAKPVIVEAIDHNVVLAWFVVDVPNAEEFERRLLSMEEVAEEVGAMPFEVTYSTPKQNRVVFDRDEDIKKTEAKFELADDRVSEKEHPSERDKLYDRLVKLYDLKYNAAPYRGLLDPTTFEPTDELPRIPADEVPVTTQQWIDRPLAPLDSLLGDAVIATDIKLMIAGAKGIGKTTFAIAIGMRASLGLPFLHLRKGRPCRVLYIDADMGRRQLKDRIVAEAKRIGKTSDTFFVLSHEDVGALLQLDTSTEARQAIEAWIEEQMDGKVDLIIFDNLMSLVEGDLVNGGAWKTLMPWIRSLTERKIGQIWLHHAGHNTKRFYGSDTTSWGIDAVMHLNKVVRSDTLISFEMNFDEKARERKPANEDQFVGAKIWLAADEWKSDAAKVEPKKITSA